MHRWRRSCEGSVRAHDARKGPHGTERTHRARRRGRRHFRVCREQGGRRVYEGHGLSRWAGLRRLCMRRPDHRFRCARLGPACGRHGYLHDGGEHMLGDLGVLPERRRRRYGRCYLRLERWNVPRGVHEQLGVQERVLRTAARRVARRLHRLIVLLDLHRRWRDVHHTRLLPDGHGDWALRRDLRERRPLPLGLLRVERVLERLLRGAERRELRRLRVRDRPHMHLTNRRTMNGDER